MQNEIQSYAVKGVCRISLIAKAKDAQPGWAVLEIRYDDSPSSVEDFAERDDAEDIFFAKVQVELSAQGAML